MFEHLSDVGVSQDRVSCTLYRGETAVSFLTSQTTTGREWEDEMWQPEIKERPRPILGRVSLCPPAPAPDLSNEDTGAGARVNFLLPPDPRRWSLVSNESAVSSASSSSLSDIWAAPGGPTSDPFSWHHTRRRSSGFVSELGVPPLYGETFSNKVTFNEECSHIKVGMENVPQWLKQLRLHKYTEFIMSLSYHELLSLNEEKLQKMNVTKGARRKILLSIEKLSERPKVLATINSKLDRECGDMKEILLELETLIKSPILILEKEKRTVDSGDDSGAEVSDDEETVSEEVTGVKLVELIVNTLKKTTSVILLSQYAESKHGIVWM